MLGNEEGVRKIQDFLKRKRSQLSDGEIEKIAQNLYELGLFFVRLKIKQHSESKELPTEKPP